ncbi:MAG: hypothetical protein ACYDGO_13215 [Smithellaceae bacterium]
MKIKAFMIKNPITVWSDRPQRVTSRDLQVIRLSVIQNHLDPGTRALQGIRRNGKCKNQYATISLFLVLIFYLSFTAVCFAQNQPALNFTTNVSIKSSITQYGITWTFKKPVRIGRFVNGDYYVVGPTTITSITPVPKDGRNGSCLNPSATIEKTGFDSRIPHGRYDPKLFLAPPVTLRPGDSLLSSISLDEIHTVKPMLYALKNSQRSPIRTVAVLTCLEAPVPADAFRPTYAGKKKQIYLARNLKRDLLPKLSKKDVSFKCYMGTSYDDVNIQDATRWFQRPWIDLILDQFGAPVENMPVYGVPFVRAVGIGSLMLCMDFSPKEKEKLLINFVQVGIDFWGIAGQGQPPCWSALGGHANGRKWPIIFAGLLLGDEAMKNPARTYPYLKFSEDAQTMFGNSWTGAKVVWAGHMGKDGHPRYADRGAYEHLPPSQWKGDTGENYRRCCTSNAWVGEALAARILHAEKYWNHDAFFAYVDRWMTEDDSEFNRIIKEARGKDYGAKWARQGSVWDPFVKDMWLKYRNHLPPSPDRTVTRKAEDTWK